LAHYSSRFIYYIVQKRLKKIREYRNVIEIQYDELDFKVQYWHDQESFWKWSGEVKLGEIIGIMGETGNSENGKHLHYIIEKAGVRQDSLQLNYYGFRGLHDWGLIDRLYFECCRCVYSHYRLTATSEGEGDDDHCANE